MSFSAEVKAELCRAPLNRRCCAQAEAYGVLLYCNTFSGGEVRIMTESGAFARRLPALFKKAFKLSFDRLPEGEGKQIFSITDPAKLAVIRQTYGEEGAAWPSTSISPCWRRAAAGSPFCGGPFWPGAR